MDTHLESLPIGYLMEGHRSMPDRFVHVEIEALKSLDVVPNLYYLDQRQCNTWQASAKIRAQPRMNDHGIVTWKNIWSLIVQFGRGLFRCPCPYIKVLMHPIYYLRRNKSITLLQALHLIMQFQRDSIEHLHVIASDSVLEVTELIHKLTGISYSMIVFSSEIGQCNQSETINRLEKAKFIVTTTEHDRRSIQSICSKKANIQCIRQSVNFNVMGRDPLKQDSTKQNGLMTILSEGPLTKEMGFSDLIYACKLLKDAKYTFQCNIVGVGPEQKSLQSLIRQLGLNQFIYLRGRLNPLLTQAVYQRTNIFVFPGRSFCAEQQRHRIPMSLLEAMANTVPVISTRLPAIQEVIEDGKNGFLIDPKSPQQIAGILITLFENQQKRNRIAMIGYNRANRYFRTDRNVAALKTLFTQRGSLDGNLNFEKLTA